MTDVLGLIVRGSGRGVDETATRFRSAAEKAGLTIFADVDHGRNASDVGMSLRPTRLLIFGNPRGGTPLMQAVQTIGIDLPFKVLIWEDESGNTWIGYNDPAFLASRHGLGEAANPAVEAITAGMSKLIAAATE